MSLTVGLNPITKGVVYRRKVCDGCKMKGFDPHCVVGQTHTFKGWFGEKIPGFFVLTQQTSSSIFVRFCSVKINVPWYLLQHIHATGTFWPNCPFNNKKKRTQRTVRTYTCALLPLSHAEGPSHTTRLEDCKILQNLLTPLKICVDRERQWKDCWKNGKKFFYHLEL